MSAARRKLMHEKLVFRELAFIKNERKEEKHMTYEKATVEMIRFDNSDVITTSNVCPGWSPNKPKEDCPANSNQKRW